MTCGIGTRTRIRRIQSHEENGGACTGDSIETLQETCGSCPAGKYIPDYNIIWLLKWIVKFF